MRPDEIIVDLFAGGGGASLGIELALGIGPAVAINHDEAAVRMHELNHPDAEHYCKDVFNVSPPEAVKGRPVGLLWASPDCTHFSRAKGGRPVSPRVRELARAQGFPDSYVLTGSKAAQVARIGNSVCPPVAAAIVRSQFAAELAAVGGAA